MFNSGKRWGNVVNFSEYIKWDEVDKLIYDIVADKNFGVFEYVGFKFGNNVYKTIWKDRVVTYKDRMINSIGNSPAVEFIKIPKREWMYNGKLHSFNDAPALIVGLRGEVKHWYDKGVLHRDNNLPAVIDVNQNKIEWWVNGKFIRWVRNKL